VLAAVVAARLGGHGLPIVGGAAPNLSLAGARSPLDAASALSGLARVHGLLLETIALSAAAAAASAFRRRGPWGGAAFGALLTVSTLLADPSAPAVPLIATAWLSAILLGLEPGATRPLPQLPPRLRRLLSRRARLRLVAGS
jgi:hypothetical protein